MSPGEGSTQLVALLPRTWLSWNKRILRILITLFEPLSAVVTDDADAAGVGLGSVSRWAWLSTAQAAVRALRAQLLLRL